MIPKQLFFIWFGNEIPKFVNFSISNFKVLNPDYNVDLIHYTIDEIINNHDSVISHCKNLIFLTKKGVNNKYFNFIRHRIDSRFNFIQILSDIIRFEILYYYGGIYLDCDTFPTHPFDDNILNHTNFAQSVMCFKKKNLKLKNLQDDYTKNYDLKFIKKPEDYITYTYTDIYFIGAIKEYTQKDISFEINSVFSYAIQTPWIRNLENTKSFIKLKDKFYKCNIKPYQKDLIHSQYILHFCNRPWQKDYKTNALYCEYDDFLYGD